MGTSAVILSAALLFLVMPSGDCYLQAILDSVSKTSAVARDSLTDVGNSVLGLAETGTKGIHNVIKYAADTVTEAQKQSIDTFNNGHRKIGEMAEEGAEALLDFGKKVGSGIRDTVYTGTRKVAKNSVEILRSGVDVIGKSSSGVGRTLKAALKQSAGKALESLPEIPVIKPVLRLPYSLVQNQLGALATFSDDAMSRSKSILDKFKPDDADTEVDYPDDKDD